MLGYLRHGLRRHWRVTVPENQSVVATRFKLWSAFLAGLTFGSIYLHSLNI
jgi:hypothetical protein